MSKPVEQYLDHVESILGGEGEFYKISDPDEPLVAVVSYSDVPEAGCVTAFSYGLSSASIAEWKMSRPELVISVNSADVAWPLAMGEMIRNGRGREHLFAWGRVLDFGEPISNESDMSAFFMYKCMVLDETDVTVTLSDRRIHLSQIYPIFKEEITLIDMVGAQSFFDDFGIDFYDVQRQPARSKKQ